MSDDIHPVDVVTCGRPSLKSLAFVVFACLSVLTLLRLSVVTIDLIHRHSADQRLSAQVKYDVTADSIESTDDEHSAELLYSTLSFEIVQVLLIFIITVSMTHAIRTTFHISIPYSLVCRSMSSSSSSRRWP